MESESGRHRHEDLEVVIDGKAHRVYRHHVPVAELFDLAERSPDDFVVEAELEGGSRLTLDRHGEVDLSDGRPAVFHMRPRHRHHDHRLHLSVVVNSVRVELDVERTDLLAAVFEAAFVRAAPAGRERGDFELKDAEGDVFDLALTVEAARIEDGATLFLSLRAGAAGEAAGEMLVDPDAARAAFDREVASFHAVEETHARRGIWLARVAYPRVTLLFGAPRLAPLRVLAFGAVVDFENYDLWAPSVRLVDPITEVPYKAEELPPQALLLRRQAGVAQGPTRPGAGPAEVGRFMVWHRPGDVPFICHAGIREYHAHPAHTGDDWMRHRGRGEGSLSWIVEFLHQHGSSKMALCIAAAIDATKL